MDFFCLAFQPVKLDVWVKLVEAPTPGPCQLHVQLAPFIELLGRNSTEDAQYDQQNREGKGVAGWAVLGQEPKHCRGNQEDDVGKGRALILGLPNLPPVLIKELEQNLGSVGQ